MFNRLSIHKFDPYVHMLFKVRKGMNQGCTVIRVDILYKSFVILYRGKAHDKWIEDIGYEYL